MSNLFCSVFSVFHCFFLPFYCFSILWVSIYFTTHDILRIFSVFFPCLSAPSLIFSSVYKLPLLPFFIAVSLLFYCIAVILLSWIGIWFLHLPLISPPFSLLFSLLFFNPFRGRENKKESANRWLYSEQRLQISGYIHSSWPLRYIAGTWIWWYRNCRILPHLLKHIVSYHILSCLILSYPILSYLMHSYPILFYIILSYSIFIQSYSILFFLILY